MLMLMKLYVVRCTEKCNLTRRNNLLRADNLRSRARFCFTNPIILFICHFFCLIDCKQVLEVLEEHHSAVDDET